MTLGCNLFRLHSTPYARRVSLNEDSFCSYFLSVFVIG